MSRIAIGTVEVSIRPTTITDVTDDVVRQLSEILGPDWDAKGKHDVWVTILNGLTRVQALTLKAGANGDYPRDL